MGKGGRREVEDRGRVGKGSGGKRVFYGLVAYSKDMVKTAFFTSSEMGSPGEFSTKAW